MYRQGDVLVVPISELTHGDLPRIESGNPRLSEIERENGRLILAHGEATGHAHAIADKHAIMFRDEKLNEIFLRADQPVSLVHDEHSTIEIPAGAYKIVRQREYDDGIKHTEGDSINLVRYVAD